MSKQTGVQIVMQSLIKKAKPLQNKLSDLEVVTQNDYDNAGALMKTLKQLAKEAEVEEKKITTPLNETLKAVRDHFRPFKDSVAELEQSTKSKMISFVAKQELKQKKLERQFESGAIKKVSTLVAKQEELNIASSSSKIRKVKVLVVKNSKLIPREYLVPDEAKIKAALLEGIAVAGCVIEEQNNIAI
jgi:hypothetical protein